MTSQQAIQKLMDGNALFLQEVPCEPQSLQKVAELARNGQHPFAAILTCADSRVSPEIIFHCGLGDLFVIRTAGQVLDSAVVGSIEYAADHLGVPLIVVLGHSKCGAVAGACESHHHVEGALDALLDAIRPCVRKASQCTSDPAEIARLAEDLDISQAVEALQNDPVLKKLPSLKIIGAKYHIETGKVVFH